MKKGLLIVVGGVVLILAVIIWQVMANLDGIVAGIIEDVGSETLKTQVSVSGVSIDLRAGTAAIAGITVANPQGYSNEKLFEMHGIKVDLDLASLSQDVLVIEAVHIDQPKVNFEGDAKGGSNMQTLLDNMDSGSSGTTESSGGEAAKMIIGLFEFTGGHVRATTELKPGEVVEYDLPPIRMKGIGQAEGGVTADVVAKQVTSELVSAVIKEAAKAGVSRLIEEKTRGLLDKFKRDG